MELKEDLQTYLGRAKSGLRAKIEYSIELCRKAAKIAPMYDDEGYLWLGFSGGKDSQALYHIAQLSGVKFKAFFSPTSVDPPEVIRFIRKNYPEVEFTPLKKSIYSEFLKRKCLPSMKIRWCCAEFKEKGGANKVVLVGVRNSESVKRSKRKEVEVTDHKFSGDFDGFNEWSEKRRIKKQKKLAKDKAQFDQFSEHKEQMVTCINGKDKIVVSPIIHWSDDDVWEFLNEVVRVPHCELYDKGRTRIGCIMCPMSKKSQILKDIEEYPHVYEKWVKAIMQLRKDALFNGSTPPKSGYGIFSNTTVGDSRYLPTEYRGGKMDKLPKRRNEILTAHLLQEWGGAIGIIKVTPPTKQKATTQRTVGGKFFDSTDGKCSTVSAQDYDEQIEREVAENIIDWWVSKKSYKQWYADKFLQHTFDFGQE